MMKISRYAFDDANKFCRQFDVPVYKFVRNATMTKKVKSRKPITAIFFIIAMMLFPFASGQAVDTNTIVVPFAYILLIVSAVLIAFTIYTGSVWVGFVTGASLIVSGIYLMANGLSNVNDNYSRMLAFGVLGLGIFVLIKSSYHAIKIFSGNEEEDD